MNRYLITAAAAVVIIATPSVHTVLSKSIDDMPVLAARIEEGIDRIDEIVSDGEIDRHEVSELREIAYRVHRDDFTDDGMFPGPADGRVLEYELRDAAIDLGYHKGNSYNLSLASYIKRKLGEMKKYLLSSEHAQFLGN